MMGKRNTLYIVFALISCTIQAQISLDSSEFPIIGTTYSMNNVAYVNVPPASVAGPNETYDFTGGFIFDGQLIAYNDATQDPFSADFPSATLSRYLPGEEFDQYLYYATSSTGFWQKGMVWVGNIFDTTTIDTLYFDWNAPNEDTLLSDLYTYGYSDSTYALSEMTLWFGGTPIDIYYHLYKKIDVDGWGTMETGFGTYDSVLRVHVTEYKFDSVFVFGSFDDAELDTIEYYLYYQEGVRYPLVKDIPEPFIDVQGTDTTFYFVTEILNIPPPPPIVLGCTDTAAVNFNPNANQDDGSCVICAPISASITPDTYICAGDSISLNVSGGLSYIWSTGDSTSSITVSPGTTTTYSVLINSSQFCWEQATVEVIVYDDVLADFWNGSANNTDTTVFVNLSINATDYFWDFGDGVTSTDESPMHYYGSLGTNTVTLIASNLCSVDTIITVVNVQVGTPEFNMGRIGLKVVPNPVSASARVVFTLDNAQTLSLEIIDVLGKEVSVFKDLEVSTGHQEIDITNQIAAKPAGVYFIHLKSAEDQAYFKWIKQ